MKPEDFPMTVSKPYLIRAIYEWIVDNKATPYILVSADFEGVIVPPNSVDENNKIVLNISANATQGIVLGNIEITFNARFSGQSMPICIPTAAVLAIYAYENGLGMVFSEDTMIPPPPPASTLPKTNEEQKPSRSHLRVVK